MREAEITCKCTQIALSDLGLSLVAGDVEYVSEEAARASHDLASARRNGGVVIRYVQRCRERRPRAPEPPLPRPAPSPPRRVPPPAGPPPTPLVLDTTQLVGEVRAAVAEGMAGLREELPGMLQEAVASIPRGTVMVPAPGSGMAVGSSQPDEPLFVPAVIGAGGLQADVSVATEDSGGGGVDEATEALRAARRRKERP